MSKTEFISAKKIVKIDLMRLESNLTMALYKSFTYLLTYLRYEGPLSVDYIV